MSVPSPLTLVTGGTRGIGAATALRLARDGHDLVLGYANDDRAAEETRLAVEDAGARCGTVRCDLTDPDGVEELFARAAEHGPLTGVVNNAGATLHIGPLAESWRVERDQPAYVVPQTRDELVANLAKADRQAAA